jgi:group I intron endonuclease
MPITVYMIENTVNDKKYIGQTCDTIKKRFADHCKPSQNAVIADAVRKYGRDSFSICALFVCPDDHDYANQMERRAIEIYGTLAPNGYNLMDGGSLNGRHSEETILKMKEARKTNRPNYRHSDKTKQKMSETRKGKPNGLLGYKHREDSKQKMSESQKRRHQNVA